MALNKTADNFPMVNGEESKAYTYDITVNLDVLRTALTSGTDPNQAISETATEVTSQDAATLATKYELHMNWFVVDSGVTTQVPSQDDWVAAINAAVNGVAYAEQEQAQEAQP